MAEISWGKCTIAVNKYSGNPDGAGLDFTKLGTGWAVIDTPVNSSTTVNIDEGEKHEAEIEGGGNEAVRYDDDKFSIEFDVRRAIGRKFIAGGGKIGRAEGTFAIAVQPENPAAPSILVEAASLKRTMSFNTSDGIYDHYVFDALVPAVGDPVKIGQASCEGGTLNERVTSPIQNCAKFDTKGESKFAVLHFYEETASYLN